ncbi:hypothetical protein HMI56_002526, partial [Coelomomyces lativittatus]
VKKKYPEFLEIEIYTAFAHYKTVLKKVINAMQEAGYNVIDGLHVPYIRHDIKIFTMMKLGDEGFQKLLYENMKINGLNAMNFFSSRAYDTVIGEINYANSQYYL